MKKIKTIALYRLKDRQFVEFALESLDIFQKWSKTFEIEALEKSYENSYQALQESYRKLKTNLYTEKIRQLDAQRDQTFRLIWHSCKAFTYDPKPQTVTAALKVLDVLNLYGGSKITNYDYNGETAAIENCLRQINKTCKPEINLLLLTEAVDQLEKENEVFRKTYEDRNEMQTENKLLGEIRKIRAQMSKIFTAIVKQMELLNIAFPDKTVEAEEFIAALNVVIMKFHPLTLPKAKGEKENYE